MSNEISTSVKKVQSLVPSLFKRRTEVAPRVTPGGHVIHSKPLPVAVYQPVKKHDIDVDALIRMIKQVTQSIGEYKDQDNDYGNRYIIPALRVARSNMVTDLESKFGIHWKIDDDGKCYFYK